jgi:hypothetical protein
MSVIGLGATRRSDVIWPCVVVLSLAIVPATEIVECTRENKGNGFISFVVPSVT